MAKLSAVTPLAIAPHTLLWAQTSEEKLIGIVYLKRKWKHGQYTQRSSQDR